MHQPKTDPFFWSILIAHRRVLGTEEASLPPSLKESDTKGFTLVIEFLLRTTGSFHQVDPYLRTNKRKIGLTALWDRQSKVGIGITEW